MFMIAHSVPPVTTIDFPVTYKTRCRPTGLTLNLIVKGRPRLCPVPLDDCEKNPHSYAAVGVDAVDLGIST